MADQLSSHLYAEVRALVTEIMTVSALGLLGMFEIPAMVNLIHTQSEVLSVTMLLFESFLRSFRE